MYKKTIIKALIICTIILLLFIDNAPKTESFSNPSSLLRISKHTSNIDGMMNDFQSLTNSCTKQEGVLDRIQSNGQAVIMIEQLSEQWIVYQNDLPDNSEIHMWFNIKHCSNTIEVISINYKKTEEKMKKSSKLMKQLQQK